MKEKKFKPTSINLIVLTLLLQTGILYSCANISNNVFPSNSRQSTAATITDDGSTTDYEDSTTANAAAVITEDLYENFTADGTVYINFNDKSFTSSTEGNISDSDITIKASANSEEDETSEGVEIQYKGKLKIKYVLSGNFTGTVFIKNKKADAAVVLNNVKLTSDNGTGTVLRFSSEQRTFIVIPADTENILTDTRKLDQTSTMYDDKKGSVYSKGALIFTGETSTSEGGSLTITNSGYKHAVYSKDYIRIANITLTVNAIGENSRDCLRALNAVIVDSGNITLTGKGTIEDDESVGIKVEGEDADEDDMTVEYTAGAGFVIINGGKLTINTVAKGITAHWKSAKSVIGDSSYNTVDEDGNSLINKSLLYNTFLSETTATKPNPYVEINGGIINITTTGEPYEGRTDDDPSCSPEGIEAKGNITINAGTITLNCTDDAINAGGNIVINGGAIYAYSSKNDAIDSNGTLKLAGGILVALTSTTPECAFDCDSNTFAVTGGLLVGIGTNNYSAPTSSACSQSTIVLSGNYFGSGNTTFALEDSSSNPVFAYTIPSVFGTSTSSNYIMILSSPEIQTGTSYKAVSGVSASGGSTFHNLYVELPEVSSGTTSVSDISTSSSSYVYTKSSSTNNGPMDGPHPNRGF